MPVSYQRILALLLVGSGLLPGAVRASEAWFQPSFNDFGGAGLMQLPSGRAMPDGTFAFGYSMVSPYNRMFVTLQATPWLEGRFRYSEITNRLFTSANDQTYKDKGFDAKIRLHQESAWLPEVSLALQDFGGTALFASEYLMASKRFYNLDVTMGLAWGYGGTRGGLTNPFTLLSDTFKNRSAFVGEANSVGTGQLGNHYFKGEEVALVGGLEYHLPWREARLKLELDGNSYLLEPLGNPVTADSPLNVGVSFRPWNWLELAAGWERGNTAMVRFTVPWDLQNSQSMPKLNDQPPLPVPVSRPPAEKPGKGAGLTLAADPGGDLVPVAVTRTPAAENPEAAVRKVPSTPARARAEKAILAELKANKFLVEGIRLDAKSAVIFATHDKFRHIPRAAGRAARIVARHAPAGVEEIRYVNMQEGLQTVELVFFRKDVERALAYRGSPDEIWEHTTVTGGNEPFTAETLEDDDRYPRTDWSITPKLRQSVGDPDTFYFWQVWLQLLMDVELHRGLSVTGLVGQNLANNFDSFQAEGHTGLPPVRSNIKQYLAEGRTNLARLEVDYLWNIAEDWYGRMSGGLLEEMFAGIGGEVLYRPHDQRWAVGLDINRVRQREFNQWFDFQEYEVTTGHLALYYQLPWYNILGVLKAGQYLAGDQGATLEFSREFDNGVRLGVFATKTDVSAAEFGEGSFDKGMFISIPLDIFFTSSSKKGGTFVFRPITRDGGAMLSAGKQLYPVVSGTDDERLRHQWGKFLE